jgi:adenine-specific DNA-methyltransferase
MNKPDSVKPERMGLTSMDVAGEKREELKRCLGQAFPEVFGEGKIDFDQLKRILGEWIDPGKERFGLNWPGKAECMKVIQQPSVATLKPARKESVNFDETENLFIEGDNLEVLKLLQKAYFGKVKMIYIDPPYNTGKEFIYPDKYAETLDTYLAYTGQIDAEGRRFSTNSESEGRFHSNWLSMMYPRLYLARNLLRDDGTMWISIDDNELNNLISLGKTIFGDENFVASFIWQKRKTRENRKVFSVSHDYIVCFAKNKDEFEEIRGVLPLTDEARARYANPDDDPRGLWQSVSINAQADAKRRKEQFYTIVTPSGRRVDPPSGRCWLYTEDRYKELVADNRIWFGADGNNVPREKMFLDEEEAGLTPHTLWLADEVGTTDSAKRHVNELFDGASVFDTPKPVELMERIAQMASTEGQIVLDFFAGSSTLAEALLRMNSENKPPRNFIMVQLPEKTDPNSEAFKAGYKTVSEIGRDRIRRAGKKIVEGVKDQLKLHDGANLDVGFRAFMLDRSNFRVWDGNASGDDELGRQIEMHIDHLSPNSSAEDVLYELLLKAGFSLTTKVQTIEMAAKQVFSIEGGSLLICLEKEITPELIDALAQANPLQVICLDEGFKGNDQLKANAVQTFKARAQAEESEIVFKTV